MIRTGKIKKRIAENVNRTYRIFLILFFSCMVVFLTSKVWLPSDVKIQNSDMGTTRTTTAGTELTLKSWQYNPDSRFMEATFTYQDSDDTQDIQFTPVAHTDTDKTVKMDVSIPYSSNGFFVIQFRNTPQNWHVVSLWIDSTENQISDLTPDTDSGIASTSGSESSETDAGQQGANFFCDVRKVSKNQSLKSQTKLYYSLRSVDNEISADKKQIALTQKKIDDANLEISQLNFDISSLKSNQKYQTPDEVSQSNAAIQNKTSQISNLKNNIAQYQIDIKNGRQKLKKLKQKWSDVRDGKFKGTDVDSSASSSLIAPTSSSKSFRSSSEKVTVD